MNWKKILEYISPPCEVWLTLASIFYLTVRILLNKTTDLSVALNSVLGEIPVLFFGCYAVLTFIRRKESQEYSEIANQQRKKEIYRSLVISFKTELFTMLTLYMKTIGDKLEKHCQTSPNEVFNWKYIVGENYMTVFDNNFNQLSITQNEKVCEDVIMAYMKAKSLLDTYRIQNELFEVQDKQHMQYFLPQLKESHDSAKLAIEKAIKTLNDELNIK